MGTLSRSLRSVRVLIVLGDVDSVEQLDALLPTKDSLQRGSLIIVTTWAYDVLKSWGISSTYKMRPFDSLQAEQLFCWHAFLKSSPLNGFKDLVEKFLKECNGLPLSLKVFGAQLYGESRKEYWESELHKISRILPDNVKLRLKISYDSLDDEEKEMFLDAACFFIGEESSLAIEAWNGLEWSGLHSWEWLLHKCLVEVEDDNLIKMHDHLKDLGRDIANQQSLYRLCFPQQIINFHKQEKNRIGIRGIMATSTQIWWNYYMVKKEKFPVMAKRSDEIDEFDVRCSHGEVMVNTNCGIWSLAPSSVGLNFFVIEGDYFNQVVGGISRELVWLRWFQIGQRNLPSGLSLKKLRVLELYENCEGQNHLEELWGETDGEVSVVHFTCFKSIFQCFYNRCKLYVSLVGNFLQAPVQLRGLLISRCQKFQGFPNSIGHLIHLKKIVIIQSYTVTSLPDEFCLIQSLEHLVLHECKMLSSLPSNFGKLQNLRHLRLSRCCKLRRLPLSFKNLMLLEHLSLEGCGQLTFTSEDLNFLENITKLEFLSLSECKQLEELPRHITNQASLRELYFSDTSSRELPVNIGQLSRLREMRIENVLLTSLPTSLGDLSSLTNLSILGCPKLECLGVKSLPKSVRQLNNLQSLSIFSCPIGELDFGVQSLPFGLSNLKQIDLIETEVCRISFSEDCCPHLESVYIGENHHLEEIKALPKTVENIYLTNCEMLKNIPSLARLTSLRLFCLEGCYGIKKIEGVENCIRLESLTVNTCWEVPGIERLEHMENLKRLSLKANKGSDIERWIQMIQKLPDSIQTIRLLALSDSLLSPTLVVVDSLSNKKIQSRAKLVQKPSSHGHTYVSSHNV